MEERATEVFTFGGRDIEFMEPTGGQIGAIAKHLDLARRDKSRNVTTVGRILEVIDHLVSEEDSQFLEDLLVAGELDVLELIKVLGHFAPAEEENEEAPANRATRRARRGR